MFSTLRVSEKQNSLFPIGPVLLALWSHFKKELHRSLVVWKATTLSTGAISLISSLNQTPVCNFSLNLTDERANAAGVDLAWGMSSGDSVEPPKLQKVGLASECQKSHFRRPHYFSEFSWGGCPWNPLKGTAFGDSYLL